MKNNHRQPKIQGKFINLREAEVEDSSFILELRTNPKKSKFINKTDPNLDKQIDYIKNYKTLDNEWYFIIEDKQGEKVGTVRLYAITNDSFYWGSWILKNGTPSSYSIESALLVYHFAISLGFKKAHFDVRKGNKSVWKFHERFGAIKIDETTDDFIYNISLEAIEKSLEKYKKYLPNGFSIEH